MIQHFKVRQYFLSEQKKQKKSHLIILCFIKVNCFYIYKKEKEKKKGEHFPKLLCKSIEKSFIHIFSKNNKVD